MRTNMQNSRYIPGGAQGDRKLFEIGYEKVFKKIEEPFKKNVVD